MIIKSNLGIAIIFAFSSVCALAATPCVDSACEKQAKSELEFLQPKGNGTNGELHGEIVQEAYYTYTVKRHDTLSQLAQKHFPGMKIYGAKGSVVAAMKLNRARIKNADLIRVNQKIRLPVLVVAQAEAVAMPNRAPSSEDPIPMAAPLAEQSPAAAPEFIPYSWINLSPSFSYYRFDGNDTRTGGNGTVLSELSPGIKFEWEPHLTERSTLAIGVSYFSDKNQTIPTQTMNKNTLGLDEIHAKYLYSLSDRFKLGLELGESEAVYFQSISVSSLNVQKAPLPYAHILGSADLFKVGTFTGQVYGGAGPGLPTTAQGTKFTSIFDEVAGLSLYQELKTFRISTNLEYYNRSFSTPFEKAQNKQLSVGFGFSWKLGGSAEDAKK